MNRARSRVADRPEADDGLPLSPAQRRLWFLDQFEEGAGTYNIARATRFVGNLDIEALRQAHDLVAQRHDILRTRYPDRRGMPRQVVEPDPTLDFAVVTDLPDGFEPLLASEAAKGFDLANGPVWRVRVVRLADDDHILLTVMHHIAADGWSFPILRSEVREAYEAAVADRDPVLPRLDAQYADFAQRQREDLALEGMAGFWRSLFEDDPDPIPLLSDRPRPRRRSATGWWVRATSVPTERLDDTARDLGVTPFVLGLTLWAAFLARTSRVTNLVVGIPEAERAWGPAEQLIGPFVNTLPIRIAVSPARSLRELAESVRERVLDALDHSMPFDDIVRHVDPRRDAGHTPLFQVMYQYRDGTFRSGYELLGLTEETVHVAGSTSKFDLTLELGSADDRLSATMSASADLYEPANAQALVDAFAAFCESVLEDADRPLRRSRVTDAATRRWLVEDWNPDVSADAADKPLTEIYREATENRRESAAIHHGDLNISHAELQEAAQEIEAELRRVGVGPGDAVGLELGRTPAGIASMLAVVAIGAVYVPLDPEHPQQRRDQMNRAAGVRVVIRPSPAGHWGDVALSSLADDVVPLDITDEPVYVMFTSGSTGTPKGVVVGRKAILRLVLNTDYVSLRPGDVVAHLSNTAFDASTFEIWGALLNGASVAIIDQDTLLSPGAFAEELSARSVTTAFVTTAWFNEMARRRPAAFAPLRELLFGGERCDPNAVRAVLEAGPPQRLIHVYGPTEATTFATWFEIREVESGAATVPIGRPIANTTVYVLDGWGEPVPPLVAGELCVGGPGVALSYVSDDEATRARFVADTFGADPWGRLYKTGDLVRMGVDGQLEFLGREDRQIKLRGFRIEPDEIELALLRHDAVAGALVRLDESDPTDRRLTAWAVIGDQVVTDSVLRAHLSSLVPSYMIPAAIVPIPSFPLSPNGKIDASQLPRPVRDPVRQTSMNEVEYRLARLFAKSLGIDAVGLSDDFFELGGHSIRAVELISAIEEEFGVRLPLSTLFEARSPAALGLILEEDRSAEMEQPIIPMRRSEGQALFIFHHPSGTVLAYEPLVRHLDWDGPVYGVQAQGVDGNTAPTTSIERMAERYVDHICRIAPVGPVALAGHSLGGLLAWETGVRLAQRGREISTLALLDTKFPQRSRVEMLRSAGYSRIGAAGSSIYRAARRFAGDVRWGLQTAWYTSRRERVPAELARVRLVRGSSRAFERYRPRPYPGGVDYFLASEQERTRVNHPRLWGEICGGIHVEQVPGTHTGPNSLLEEPNVVALAHALGRRLTVVGLSEGIST